MISIEQPKCEFDPTGINGNYAWNFKQLGISQLSYMPYQAVNFPKEVPHIHWMCSSKNSGIARFTFLISLLNGKDETKMEPIHVETVHDGIPYIHMISEVIIPDKFKKIITNETVIWFNVFRDGDHVNDTLPADLFVIA